MTVDAAKAKLAEWQESLMRDTREEMLGIVSEEQIESFLRGSPCFKVIAALEAVLELHGPSKQNPMIAQFYGYEPILVCASCWGASVNEELCSVEFPCPTVQAVLKALRVEEE